MLHFSHGTYRYMIQLCCFGSSQNCATFTSWPITQTTAVLKEAENTIQAESSSVCSSVSLAVRNHVGRRTRSEASGSHLPSFQEPITTVVPSGTFVDYEISCDITIHKQMHVWVGVLKDLHSSDIGATGKLQLLDDKPVSGNMVLVLRQPRLSTPSQLPSIPWPCDNESIIYAKAQSTSRTNWFSWFSRIVNME